MDKQDILYLSLYKIEFEKNEKMRFHRNLVPSLLNLIFSF